MEFHSSHPQGRGPRPWAVKGETVLQGGATLWKALQGTAGAAVQVSVAGGRSGGRCPSNQPP